MSLKKIINKRGPRMDPWGTPEVTGRGEEWVVPTLTDCVRSERYECN